MVGLCCSPVIWTLTFFCLLINLATGKIDWCSLECSGGDKNTMCEYKPQTSTGSCTDIKMSTTPQSRKQMLKLHNEYRNNLATGKAVGKNGYWPKAANMRLMTWDNDLELLALRWVQQCVAGHDKCRRSPKFAHAGQNWGMQGVGGSGASYPSWDGIFKAWYDEITLIDNHDHMIDHFALGDGGHFTQVVWANSYKLGCAEVHYKKNGMLNTAGVCNYVVHGNFLSQKMYEKGEPCSKCPEGTSCNKDSPYPSLCAAPGESGKEEDIPGPPPDDFVPPDSVTSHCRFWLQLQFSLLPSFIC